jgi:arylsulfatase A-like enzyme
MNLLYKFIGASLLLLTICTVSAEKPVARPNFLFLIADDLSPRLGCYGDKAAITPNLDRLARDGITFTHAYAQGAVCIPSRTSFMLGLNNHHADCNYFKFHPETMTMGRWFREHGYQTFSVGKIDHDETYTDPKAWDIRVPISDFRLGATPVKKSRFDEDKGLKRETFLTYSRDEKVEATSDWARTERAIQFLKSERQENKPFFAAVGFLSPHTPWETTEEIYKKQNSGSYSLEWPPPAEITQVTESALHYNPGLDFSEELQQQCQQQYYATIGLLDQQIGRLMKELEKQDLLKNTIIVFISDQGFHLGWRGQWIKHTISEQVLRVPLIVCMPDGVKNSKADGIVELLDLFPTFCEMAGIPDPGNLDGSSFVPLLKNPKAEGKPAAFTSMPPGWGYGRTVRTKNWRLIERIDGTRELYNHPSDKDEYFNVINKPENTSIAKELHVMLEEMYGTLNSETDIQKAN